MKSIFLLFMTVLAVPLLATDQISTSDQAKEGEVKEKKEFRFGGTMGRAKEGFDPVAFKKAVLSADLLKKLVKEHKLVEKWSLAGVDAAMVKIRKSFQVKVKDGLVKISYQDKEKDLAKMMLKSIMNGYYRKVQDEAKKPKPRQNENS